MENQKIAKTNEDQQSLFAERDWGEPSPQNLPDLFRKIYYHLYSDQSDALANLAAKNHKNGSANALAQLLKDLGIEFFREV